MTVIDAMTDALETDEPQVYDGDLEVTAPDDDVVRVGVHLSGFFQPIDGQFRWHGRTEPDAQLGELATRVGRKEVAVRLPGQDWTPARLGEQNPWGGFRIAGRGRPPFPVEPVAVEAPTPGA